MTVYFVSNCCAVVGINMVTIILLHGTWIILNSYIIISTINTLISQIIYADHEELVTRKQLQRNTSFTLCLHSSKHVHCLTMLLALSNVERSIKVR